MIDLENPDPVSKYLNESVLKKAYNQKSSLTQIPTPFQKTSENIKIIIGIQLICIFNFKY